MGESFGRRSAHESLPTTAGHPTRTNLGVEVDIDLVLKDRRLVSRQLPQQPLNPPDFGLAVGVLRPYDRPRTQPGQGRIAAQGLIHSVVGDGDAGTADVVVS
jgi:hypothetical protein